MSLKGGFIAQTADLIWHNDDLMWHMWTQHGAYEPNTVQVIQMKIFKFFNNSPDAVQILSNTASYGPMQRQLL